MEIKLKFENTTTRLAGNPYGKEIYDSQVKGKYEDFSEPLIIVFPDNITKVASSFVQGFFSDLVEKIGFSSVEDRVDILSENPNITKKNVMGKLFEGTTN